MTEGPAEGAMITCSPHGAWAGFLIVFTGKTQKHWW